MVWLWPWNRKSELTRFCCVKRGIDSPRWIGLFWFWFSSCELSGFCVFPQNEPVANIKPKEKSPDIQRNKLSLLSDLDHSSLAEMEYDPQVEAAIQNYETAYQMQTSVPELMDLSGESEIVKKSYGMDSDFKNTRTFGMQCLLARRLVERGVRFIELTCPGGNGDRWDQHGGLVDGHSKNCKSVDQPIAALIRDLRKLGMLDETLVVWTGEFGRTPFAQGSNGRTITRLDLPLGLLVVVSSQVLRSERPMSLVIKRWRTVMKFMICMQPCCIY